MRRVERMAEAAAARAAGRLAERLRAELPGLRIEAGPGGVTIAGRDLARRAAAMPELRWIGGLMR